MRKMSSYDLSALHLLAASTLFLILLLQPYQQVVAFTAWPTSITAFSHVNFYVRLFINGASSHVNGSSLYDNSTVPGKVNTTGQFGPLSIPQWNPLLFGGSAFITVTFGCVVINRIAANINDLTGGNFNLSRTSEITASDGAAYGSIVGDFAVKAISPSLVNMTGDAIGSYIGPTDISRIDGWNMTLHQAGPGKITTTLSQIIHTMSHGNLTQRVDSTLTYTTMKTLPGDEIEVVKITGAAMNFTSRDFSVNATGVYQLAPTISTSLNWITAPLSGIMAVFVMAVVMSRKRKTGSIK